MQVTQQMLNEVSQKWWDIARAVFPKLPSECPPAIINARLTSTAGRCHYNGDSVKCDYSKSLMEANWEDYCADTIPHELAHGIAWLMYRERGHGSVWRSIFETLTGKTAVRCHSYDVNTTKKAASKKTVYLYTCNACQMQVEFSPQRHAWVRKGKQYLCNCGGWLMSDNMKRVYGS